MADIATPVGSCGAEIILKKETEITVEIYLKKISKRGNMDTSVPFNALDVSN